MSARAWAYHWSEALRGLWRNGFMSLASISTVAVCLAVLAAVLLVAVNLQYMASFVENQVQIVAFVDRSFDRVWKDRLSQEIAAIPGVKEATFVTREEALTRLKRSFGEHERLLEGLNEPGSNPLRDRVHIRLSDPQRAGAVARALAERDEVDEVLHQEDVLQKLLAVTGLVRVGGLVTVGLLGVATVFIVSNTIRLTVYARRREIGIMKLVGATDGFIRWPFFLEGLVLGVVGGAMAAGLAWMGYDALIAQLRSAMPFLPLLGQQPLVWNLTQLLLLVGAVVGAVGSLVSVRRFLRA